MLRISRGIPSTSFPFKATTCTNLHRCFSSKPVTHYDTLGVHKSASAVDIKKAYHMKAKQCHPDLHANDKKAEQKFVELSDSYGTLKDSSKRGLYDQQLSFESQFRAAQSSPHGGSRYRTNVYHTMDEGMFVDVDDMFNDFSREQAAYGEDFVNVMMNGMFATFKYDERKQRKQRDTFFSFDAMDKIMKDVLRKQKGREDFRRTKHWEMDGDVEVRTSRKAKNDNRGDKHDRNFHEKVFHIKVEEGNKNEKKENRKQNQNQNENKDHHKKANQNEHENPKIKIAKPKSPQKEKKHHDRMHAEESRRKAKLNPNQFKIKPTPKQVRRMTQRLQKMFFNK